MVAITRRTSQPTRSGPGEQILAQYGKQLRVEEDLARATIRNYLSDLRHFAAWCEFTWKQGREAEPSFAPGAVITPTLTDYRTYLQHELHLKPNSVNRNLVSLKRYFAWLLSTEESYIGLLNSWDMIRSIQPCSIFVGQSKICSKKLKR